MVTLTLKKLLEMKKQYHEQWPGGQAAMPRGVFRTYRNLLKEIKAAARRNQLGLPGMPELPDEGQPGLL